MRKKKVAVFLLLVLLVIVNVFTLLSILLFITNPESVYFAAFPNNSFKNWWNLVLFAFNPFIIGLLMILLSSNLIRYRKWIKIVGYLLIVLAIALSVSQIVFSFTIRLVYSPILTKQEQAINDVNHLNGIQDSVRIHREFMGENTNFYILPDSYSYDTDIYLPTRRVFIEKQYRNDTDIDKQLVTNYGAIGLDVSSYTPQGPIEFRIHDTPLESNVDHFAEDTKCDNINYFATCHEINHKIGKGKCLELLDNMDCKILTRDNHLIWIIIQHLNTEYDGMKFTNHLIDAMVSTPSNEIELIPNTLE